MMIMMMMIMTMMMIMLMMIMTMMMIMLMMMTFEDLASIVDVPLQFLLQLVHLKNKVMISLQFQGHISLTLIFNN